MSDFAEDITTEAVIRMQRELIAWLQFNKAQSALDQVLTSKPYIVAAAGGLALRIEQREGRTYFIPKRMRPGLCGISHFAYEDACNIASRRGGPYEVRLAHTAINTRIAELKSTIEAFKAFSDLVVLS